MKRFICLIFLFNSFLFALDIDAKKTLYELLPHAQIYIDHNKLDTIHTVQDKEFQPNSKEMLSYGYSPDFDVWIRLDLHNTSPQTIHRIIEYENPLTSTIMLYEVNPDRLLGKDGLLATAEDRKSIHPSFKITLLPNESKTFYIQATSNITTLIVQMKLWNEDAFYKKEIHYQSILALFFGAMGIIIIYNLIIYLSTRDRSYLYYVLAFVGITVHHLFYRGVANLYILSHEGVLATIKYSSFIVAIPTLFLALFTMSILNTKQYPKLNRFLNYSVGAFILLTILFFLLDLNQLRSIAPVVLLFILFGTTIYALLRNNRQARFIMIGWILFFTSALLMFLSSWGIYDIFVSYPYYTEFSITAESVIFSLSLADKIKQLGEERIVAQNKLISYQEEETDRLSHIVEDKTGALKKSLEEKKLLLRELNHRVKNSMQTIVSFLRLQRDETKSKDGRMILQNVENKVFAINDLYALLNTKENISTVNAHDYFSSLISNVQKSFQKPHIAINLDTKIQLNSDDAVYCGFILNEAITNIYQHAFNHTNFGEAFVTLNESDNVYHFMIKDNGIGFTYDAMSDTLGITIIETLAKNQLGGELRIDTENGTEINILWSNNERN
jgi:two-component system, sensor histidine kinase LadS